MPTKKKTQKTGRTPTLKSLAARVAALEKTVGGLPNQADESPVTAEQTDHSAKPPKFWAIEKLERLYPDKGGVAFAGRVTLPTEKTYAWQIQAETDEVLSADWSAAQAPLAALAHPVRLTILNSLLHGQSSTQELQNLAEIGTTGQLYHHLKELESAGWVRQPQRGHYALLAERVVPLLAILSACEVVSR
ncbi:MAG: winged helix-turn-helix domain-containing protein [Planctomycetota bacterium]